MTRAAALGQPAATDLAIAGGGSVGVSFLYQFLLALRAEPRMRPPTIHLFEPNAAPGPGGAYQDDLRSNLLNIPAGNMSARADHRLDFVDWLREQDADWLHGYGVTAIDPADFLPRPLFGAYMRAVYGRCHRLSEALGVTLVHVPSRVHRVVPQPDGRVHVQPDHGVPLAARHVVLCNGNLPSQAFPALEGVAGYFNSPYPVSALADVIAPDASVCIVGTSLSAVDAVAALQQAGHRGPMLCVSRNGRLPSVRSPHNRAPGTLQQLSLDGAIALAARHGGGQVVAGVSVLGSLAGGTYFWTTSMDVNARLAREQAERIAATLRAARATDPRIPGDIPSLERWTAHRPPHPAQAASS